MATIRSKFCNTFGCSLFSPSHGSRQLLAGHSPHRNAFEPRPVRLGFVVDKVPLGQVLLRVLLFSPVSIVPPMLHTNIYVVILSSEGQASEKWEPSKKAVLFQSQGTHIELDLYIRYAAWATLGIYIVVLCSVTSYGLVCVHTFRKGVLPPCSGIFRHLIFVGTQKITLKFSAYFLRPFVYARHISCSKSRSSQFHPSAMLLLILGNLSFRGLGDVRRQNLLRKWAGSEIEGGTPG